MSQGQGSVPWKPLPGSPSLSAGSALTSAARTGFLLLVHARVTQMCRPPVLGCLHKLGFSSTGCGSCRPCRAVWVALFGFPEPFRRWEMLCVPCLPLSSSVILTPLSALPPTPPPPPPPPPQEGPGFHVGGSGLHPQHLEQSVSGRGSTRQCCHREVWFLWPFLQGIQRTCILLYS